MTLMDYPGQVAAVVFLAGCNFRCRFCHNPELVDLKPDQKFIDEQEFWNLLKSREDVLDGVCISGGEPLLYPDLPEFIKKIKDLGFLVKLDTNGLNFSLLKQIIEQNLVDYIAMDIKASLENYAQITRIKADFNNIAKSIKLIMASGLDYEFRSTVLPKFHNEQEVENMAQMISGAKKYYLQNFRNQLTLDPALQQENCFTQAQLDNLWQIAKKHVEHCEIRS